MPHDKSGCLLDPVPSLQLAHYKPRSSCIKQKLSRSIWEWSTCLVNGRYQVRTFCFTHWLLLFASSSHWQTTWKHKRKQIWKMEEYDNPLRSAKKIGESQSCWQYDLAATLAGGGRVVQLKSLFVLKFAFSTSTKCNREVLTTSSRIQKNCPDECWTAHAENRVELSVDQLCTHVFSNTWSRSRSSNHHCYQTWDSIKNYMK